MTATPSSSAVAGRLGRAASSRDLLPLVREGLRSALSVAREEGAPEVRLRGQLIRPVVGMASLRRPDRPPDGFWHALLAIQLAHEASLVHDDILDGAPTRRGEPSLVAADGVARALLEGDHLLTLAYRAAAHTGSPRFMQLFATAVERTVAGEKLQGRSTGQVLGWARYREVAELKSGELLGCALAAAPSLEGQGHATEFFDIGRRVGLLYQMLDDLLDYCPSAETGKAPLSDYGQARWTWVLQEVPGLAFGADPEDVVAALHAPVGDGRSLLSAATPLSPMQRALRRLTHDAGELREALTERIPGEHVIGPIIDEWLSRARQAVVAEAGLDDPTRPAGDGSGRSADNASSPGLGSDRTSVEAALRSRIPALSGAEEYMARHSRSFRFACRLFPAEDAARVAGVYAYCRITDDLVDQPMEGFAPAALLDTWVRLSRRAYGGEPSELPLLDSVMREMAEGGVPFSYAEQLAEGMRMDLRGERYGNLDELRTYTYRVASVVGLWLTRLFDVHDPWMLERAERLGHAMQLTNILRDVGEDLDRGRVYLPGDLMRRHAVEDADLARMRRQGRIGPGYRALLEELMEIAEADYAAALEAVPALPPSFGRPVAVAAHVYRGIHREIRRRDYDNLRQRAYTGRFAKGVLAARGLWRLYAGQRVTRAADPAPMGASALASSRISAPAPGGASARVEE